MEGSYVFPSSVTQVVAQDTAHATSPSAAAAPLSSSASSIPTEDDSTTTPPPKPDQQERKKKVLQAAKDRDLDSLKKLAGEVGGFVDHEGRRAAWPVLLGVGVSKKGKEKSDEKLPPKDEGKDAIAVEEVVPHKDEGQVRLDVIRSFVSYPVDISADEKENLRLKLSQVILHVLRKHPKLHYFQGYHDIISVLLLVLDDVEVTQAASERMTLHRIRDSLGPGLEPVLGYLKLLLRILEKEDLKLAKTIEIAAALPYFSLSWVLTLLSHDLTSLAVIARLFDFLLAYNPAMVSYFGVAIVLHKKADLDKLDPDSAEDPAILHHTLSQLPNLIDESLEPPSLPSHSLPSQDDSNSNLDHSDLDEDLMSNRSRSPSLSTSYLTESILSTDDDEDDLEALDDSMLSDPDVTGPAFIEIRQPPPPSQPRPTTRRKSTPPLPSISIDQFITKSIELYSKYPLIGGEEGIGINADEIMGSKSCIFTWPLSLEGKLTDEEAEKIIADGIDIIVPESILETKEKEKVELEEEEERRRKRKALIKRNRRREVGLGTALAVVGVAGVLLAIYGLPIDGKFGKVTNGWKFKEVFWRGGWW